MEASESRCELPALTRARGLVADFLLLLLSMAVVIVPLSGRLMRDQVSSVTEQALEPLTLEINTAPWYEWTLLEGVGGKRAQRIVEYRRSHGPFRSIEDLNAIPGMPKGWVKNAAPLLRVEWREKR